jgi:hypothetical protein
MADQPDILCDQPSPRRDLHDLWFALHVIKTLLDFLFFLR